MQRHAFDTIDPPGTVLGTRRSVSMCGVSIFAQVQLLVGGMRTVKVPLDGSSGGVLVMTVVV